ncbi:fumarylacetoacetate hydrolase family protein [Sphingopyxis chilensis]|uniref:fumarylacetoacetate hydrolase family protein n=1 Tax=Sphingopyxis chilensis TaxID=180400 RepID=UPI002DDDA1B4|nr:fumarylacetoacetate hydrolase family protein [Sphingopyxis chilensis]
MSRLTSAIAFPLPLSADRSTRSNQISPEAKPIAPRLAPASVAFTLAQTVNDAGETVTLLVTTYEGGDTIEAIDLTTEGAPAGADIFDAIAAVGDDKLHALQMAGGSQSRYALGNLLPSGAMTDRHLATGTNFAEHAKEAGSNTVFNFPKFGKPSPARTTLVVHPGTLMDYEVEISVRFDRDVASLADFEAARKGFFLCGDFTDRATLLREIDPQNVPSGRGFSDAKSGPDYFPTGPFLVVPHDWRAFVKDERIVTRVNGTVKQDARGSAMILDFEALVAKALTNGGGGNYTYKGSKVPLLEQDTIPRGAAVMSGTSEGVLFMPPMPEDKKGGIIDHILLGRFLRGKSPFFSVINRFVRNELKAGRYMKVGDTVEHLSSTMGALVVRLVAP